MKKLITVFAMLIIGHLPAPVFALDVEDCDFADEYECYCPDSVTVDDINQSTVNSNDECYEECKDLAEEDPGISRYAARCPIDGELTGLINRSLDSGQALVEEGTETIEAFEESYYAPPALGVEIPGLVFTDASKDEGVVSSNYLGEYIEAVYIWLISAASIVAIVVLMLGGLEYMLARGKPAMITKATERMKNAVIGMMLLLGAYTIAFLLDPATVQFSSLQVTHIDTEQWFPPEGEDVNVFFRDDIPGNTELVTGDYISPAAENNSLNPDAAAALEAASIEFHEATQSNIVLSSAARSVEKQATLFYDNCLSSSNHSCSVITCNPAAGSSIISGNSAGYTLKGALAGATDRTTIINALVSNANLANCPHTSTIAVDVWCNDGGGNYVHDPSCQHQLSKIMINNGFCRITAEAWHFELNSLRVSSACSTANTLSYTIRGTTYTPDLSCDSWDYKNHTCK
ncbi:MAG: pilin [bacterium]